MKKQLYTLAILVLPAVAAAANGLDGGAINVSHSTNTTAYTLKVWSDGHAMLSSQGSPDKPFSIDAALAQKFLSDAKAGRSDPGTAQHCMKSASFGTTTTVLWHTWTSPDLQCPPFSAAVTALASDVRAIQAAGKVGTPMRRIPLPIEPRMAPPSASMSPSPESELYRP